MKTIMVPSKLLVVTMIFAIIPHKTTTQCFLDLGCFNNGPPWQTLKRLALPPENPEKVCNYFYFHNRMNSAEGIAFPVVPEINLTNVPIEPDKPTVLIIHGFLGSSKTGWVSLLKNAYLKRSDVNVILIDYSLGANGVYPQVVGNSRIVAAITAKFIENSGLNPSTIEIAGHSLGSHIASYIGKHFKTKGMEIQRITAMDPASPMFEEMPQEVRLDKSDAKLVVVHHTSRLGMLAPCGHIDIYYNDGVNQPGCSKEITCSHYRATAYLIEELNSACFKRRRAKFTNFSRQKYLGPMRSFRIEPTTSEECKNSECLGVSLDRNESDVRGIFQVETNAKSPFCK